ncbi:MAG: YhcN/YlaJ family sporulation lipoprotein [Christensenellaceae bacterium]|nr:YhcN/YlaJ family sporulation lipoprotein [Christensenellaceae bacterium]
MKKILATLTLMVLCAAMTACTATANDLPMTTTNAPMATNTVAPTNMIDGVGDMLMPDATNGLTDGLTDPMSSEDPEVTGVTTVSTARRAVEQIEDELERLSEVKDAEVVLAGNSAAVALKFDNQYKGGVDDRLTGIVKERISGVISGVTNIAVTADETLMDQLETLGERLEAASDMADIQNELNAIISKINAA